MHLEAKYDPKYSSPLHEKEIEALKIVWKMAEGNLHCLQDDKRKKAMKLIERMILNGG